MGELDAAKVCGPGCEPDRKSMSALDSVEPGLVVRFPTTLSLPDSKRQIKPVFPMSHLDNARNVATNYENHASERLSRGIDPSSCVDRHMPCYNAL